MDIKSFLENRVERKTAVGKPFGVFEMATRKCYEAVDYMLVSQKDQHAQLLERAVVVSMVSAIEVYCKDTLDLIFKYCDPVFFEPFLKQIHPRKYDISELVDFYRHRVHPLELISANQSFQNAEAIDAIFGKFLGKSLWGSVFGMRLRVKDDPETELELQAFMLDELKQVFALRHKLVHYPTSKPLNLKEIAYQIQLVTVFFMGVDIVLTEMMLKNKDPELDAVPQSVMSRNKAGADRQRKGGDAANHACG